MGRKKKYNTEEEQKEAYRQYYNTEKWKEYRREYYKQYYHNNKEYRKKRIKYCKEHNEEYYSTPIGRAKKLLNVYNHMDIKANRGKGDLTAKWIIENIFPKPCIYCGETGWEIMGCDRIDNSLPHTKDNVVPCCGKCNIKRGRKSFEEFLKLVNGD